MVSQEFTIQKLKEENKAQGEDKSELVFRK